MVFDNILSTIFGPLLELPMLWTIISLSFIMTVIITIVYKFMTDQKLMKTLKDDMKAFQQEMKELKDHPDKVLAVQKKAMQTNMKYMMHSMKPTLITFIPLIIIFGWMHGHLAFEPINPNTQFETSMKFDEIAKGEATLIVPEEFEIISESTQEIQDGSVVWTVKSGESGEYVLEYEFNEDIFNKEILITEENKYKQPEEEIGYGNVESIKVHNTPVKPLNLFGWEIGWLGTYIIFSIVFSITLRKLLKIH